MTEVFLIHSNEPNKVASKLRYQGWFVKKVGRQVYHSKEPFKLPFANTSSVQKLIEMLELEVIGSLTCESAEEAVKLKSVIYRKVGTHPILAVRQSGSTIIVQLKNPLPQELFKRPKCFKFWLRALYQQFGMGALIILNKNLRSWEESEWSINFFKDWLTKNE